MQVLSAESAASSTQSSAPTHARRHVAFAMFSIITALRKNHHLPSSSSPHIESFLFLPLTPASPPLPPWIQVCGLKQSEDLNELNELNMSVLRCPRIQLSVLSFLSLLSRCWRQGCLRCLRTSHRGLLAGPCCLRPAQHSTAARVNTRKKVVP